MKDRQKIYLDYNGSAPVDTRVVEAMLPVLSEGVGNASASHRFGRFQAAAVEQAREQVAALVGGRGGDVVFTAGATEANNLALRGVVEGGGNNRRRILVSAVEHASVHQTTSWLSDRGIAKSDVIPATKGGFVDPNDVEALLEDDVGLVSVMAANSETGVLNDVAAIAERVHACGALFHCDATQLVGRLPFDMQQIGADLVSISGHKICGPGGVGALIGTRRSLRQLQPIIHGGGQERGLRSGSLNVAGIVGFGRAAELAESEWVVEAQRVGGLRDRLVSGIRAKLPNVSENGDVERRLPNTASIRFVDAVAEAVVAQMDPVAVSTGSACSAGSIDPSAVLIAMGLSRDAAFETVRFSLGRFTTAQEIDAAVEATVTAVRYVRDMTQETH